MGQRLRPMPVVLREPLPVDAFTYKALIDMLTCLPRSVAPGTAATLLAYAHGRGRLRVAYPKNSPLADWYLRGLGESHYKTLGFASPQMRDATKVIPVGPFFYAPGCALCDSSALGTCASCVVYTGLRQADDEKDLSHARN